MQNETSQPLPVRLSEGLGPGARRIENRICPYPTTQMVTGCATASEHIARSAATLYDEWVCDRRWDAIDVVRLLFLECAKRGHPLTLDDGDMVVPGPND